MENQKLLIIEWDVIWELLDRYKGQFTPAQKIVMLFKIFELEKPDYELLDKLNRGEHVYVLSRIKELLATLEKREIMTTEGKRIKITREQLIEKMLEWLAESGHKTLIRVFNEEFEDVGLSYDVDSMMYEMDAEGADNLGIDFCW